MQTFYLKGTLLVMSHDPDKDLTQGSAMTLTLDHKNLFKVTLHGSFKLCMKGHSGWSTSVCQLGQGGIRKNVLDIWRDLWLLNGHRAGTKIMVHVNALQNIIMVKGHDPLSGPKPVDQHSGKDHN